jgi:hypothetical protein
VLKSILFPSGQPSRKRRRIDHTDEHMDVDATDEVDVHRDSSDSGQWTWEIVLESPSERFLISPSSIDEGDDAEKDIHPPRRYTISQIVEGDRILPEATVINGEEKPLSTVKSVELTVDTKPSPPTWSTPPTKSDPTPTADSMLKTSSLTKATKQSQPPTKAATKPNRAKPTIRVLSSDRGLEHIHFSATGISVEGLDISSGVNEIHVKRWRRASLEEFVAS